MKKTSKNNWPEPTKEEAARTKKINEAIKFLEEENFVVIFNKDKMIHELTEEEFDLLDDLGYVNNHPQVRYYFRHVSEMGEEQLENYKKRIKLLKELQGL